MLTRSGHVSTVSGMAAAWLFDISHVTHCPKYQHLKEGKDLVNSDADLVQHFREVIKLRDIDRD